MLAPASVSVSLLVCSAQYVFEVSAQFPASIQRHVWSYGQEALVYEIPFATPEVSKAIAI